VRASHENVDRDRCVDVFERPDGTFGFEEFRKDPEDLGRWTPVAYFSGTTYATADEAQRAATRLVPWFTASG